MTDFLKQFLLDRKETVAANDLECLYQTIDEQGLGYRLAGELTETLFSCRIDPMDYMEDIPAGYLCNTAVEEYTIPDKVEEIGYYAFGDAMKLRKVTFPKNLTEIFSSAFIYCIKLEHVDLSNTNLRYIQPEAFLGCRSLFSVTLPASVKLIREEAFKYCDNLEEITFLGTVKQWEGIDDLANWGAGSRVKKVTCSDGIFYREDRT